MSASAPGFASDALTRDGRATRVASQRLHGLRADLPWLLGIGVALAVACGLPYVVAAVAGPAGLEHIGTFWFARDFSQYQAAMRQGAQHAGWLLTDQFSAEPHAPALMYVLYVALGKLGAATGVSALALFAVCEWLGRAAILASVYWLTATFIPRGGPRLLAVALALGTLGLDAWLIPIRLLLPLVGLGGVADLLPDTVNPYLEVSSFGVLLSAPHLMFGLALTLACVPLYLRAIERPGVARVATLGGAVLLLSLVHSFNTPVLASVLLVHAAWTGRRAWPAAVMAGAAAAPMGLYSLLLYARDPFWSGTYSVQNLMPAPAPWTLPFDYGLVLIAAPLAWSVVRTWSSDRRRLALVWIVGGLLWMYAPVPYQRRFGFGVQPMLAILAAIGLIVAHQWVARRGWGAIRRRALTYSVVLAATSTSVLVYLALIASAMTNKPVEVYLWTTSEATAADWLAQHSSASDVILASTELANPLVGVIDGRVVHGHIVATLRSDAKKALVERFFSVDATSAERTALLRQSGATLVAFGPYERALGASSLDDVSALERVYDRDGVSVYRVLQ